MKVNIFMSRALSKKCTYISILVLIIAIIAGYLVGRQVVVAETVFYQDDRFSVILREKLFPGIFMHLMPCAPGDGGNNGTFDFIVIKSDGKKIGPFAIDSKSALSVRENCIVCFAPYFSIDMNAEALCYLDGEKEISVKLK